MVETDTLFQTKTAKKNIPFGAARTFIAYIRDYPSPPPGRKTRCRLLVSLLTQGRLKMCSEVRLSPTVVAHVSSACEALMIYGYALETPFWAGSPKVMTRSHVSRLIPKPISRASKSCLGLNKYKQIKSCFARTRGNSR